MLLSKEQSKFCLARSADREVNMFPNCVFIGAIPSGRNIGVTQFGISIIPCLYFVFLRLCSRTEYGVSRYAVNKRVMRIQNATKFGRCASKREVVTSGNSIYATETHKSAAGDTKSVHHLIKYHVQSCLHTFPPYSGFLFINTLNNENFVHISVFMHEEVPNLNRNCRH